MRRILIITEDGSKVKSLALAFKQKGFAYSVAPSGKELARQIAEQSPDVILLNLAGHSANAARLASIRKISQDRRLPVIAIIDKAALVGAAVSPDIDDFVVEPPDINELAIRINRLLQCSSGTGETETVKSGDMNIDVARCEVSIKGKPVQLAFKEYELLKFLASNPGRVFSRDAILNKVWGYDYYGGDRTVDVHIRRLRSKIEETSDQTYIETVRNIGYRFKTVPPPKTF